MPKHCCLRPTLATMTRLLRDAHTSNIAITGQAILYLVTFPKVGGTRKRLRILIRFWKSTQYLLGVPTNAKSTIHASGG